MKTILGCVASAAVCSAALAAPLTPGNSVHLGVPHFVPPVPALGSAVADMHTPFVAGTFSGTLHSYVFNNDPFNPGFLTFAYSVTNNQGSSDAIHAFAVNGFGGWLIDGGVDPQGPVPLPYEISRSLSGGEVTSLFADTGVPGFTNVYPGMTSGLTILRTNATEWGTNIGAVINGSIQGNIDILAPVPTPGAGALLGLGTLAAFRRRR